MKRLLALALAALALAACGSASDSADRKNEGGPWSYVSGDGKT